MEQIAGPIEFRFATAEDQPTIAAMVQAAHLNPRGLDWRNFLLARRDGGIVGIAQVRPHADGSRELASLMVREDLRHAGIATKLVDRLVADETARLHIIIDGRHAAHFARWNFRPLPPREAPPAVRSTYRIGRVITTLATLFAAQPIRLAILERPARR